MLDTRKINDFVETQKLINQANVFGDEKFTSWHETDKAIILSDVLKEHIQNFLKTGNNLEKLNESFQKIGIKKFGKLAVMTNRGAFAIFEPIGEKQVMFITGDIYQQYKFFCSCILDYTFRGENDDWCEFKNISITNHHKDADQAMVDDMVARVTTAWAATFLFLHFIEVETVFVQPGHKFKAKKYEGFKNQQKKALQVADLGWSKEVINQIPYGVCGHLRNQVCGPARQERKLIYIEPFLKQGYVRKSGKERILGL